MSGVPIGAVISYKWLSNDRSYEGYVSLGEYIEANNADSYGVDDDTIFYYSTADELVKYLTDNNGEWQLLSIDEWVYA